MELGELISELRMDKGLSQKELGKLINKSDSAICNYEKGVHFPDLATIGKLADCFDVSIDYLLQRTSFKYGVNRLNTPIANDYTLGDLLNTIVQLDTNNRKRLIDYIGLLSLKNSISKNPKRKDSE